MLNYTWSEDYSVGDPILDSHHHALLNMINQLSDLLDRENSIVAMMKLLADLKDYTIFHFDAEEKKMSAANYPDYDAHVLMHQTFIDQVSDSMEKVLENPNEAAEELIVFLSQWLVTHIQEEDMAYKGKI